MSKIKLTDSDRMTIRADKNLASLLESTDSAAFNEYVARVNRVASVLNQQGDGANLRFSGAASHDFSDNATAYVATVRTGMIPRAS